MEEEKKHVIIINGKGGVGKDEFCRLAGRFYSVRVISSIDPIKSVAKYAGWGGLKTKRDRKFLSDLKKLTTDYNEFSFKYLIKETLSFIWSNKEVLFVHIREPEEIDRYLDYFRERYNYRLAFHTILIKRDTGIESYGNTSDDECENYTYDYIIENNGSLKDLSVKCKEALLEIRA